MLFTLWPSCLTLYISLIEGTFADVWSANVTVAYYSFLALASFTGAATGMPALMSIRVNAHVFVRASPRWFHLCLWGLAMDAMDCAYPRSGSLSVWNCATGYIFSGDSTTQGKAQRHTA